MSGSIAGSALSKFKVAGTICSRRLRVVRTDSSAPTAPIECPSTDFGAYTEASGVTAVVAAASEASLTDVYVACAFT
jgi:hypothetical protein